MFLVFCFASRRRHTRCSRDWSSDVCSSDLQSVDAGHGWLVFALPLAEAAFHPSDENGAHELYLMCQDLKAEIASLAKKNVRCSTVEQARWGSITKIPLPGGGQVGLYEPKHPTALGLK